MGSALTRITDLLFGAATPRDRSPRWLARYLVVATVLALVIFARRPDAILRPQFWAEDGRSFFYDQLTLGFWGALRRLHGGLPYLAARLVAALGSAVPTVAIPLVYNASTMVITALSMATFALPAFRHLVRSDGLRVAVCLAAVLIPASEDLLISPTSLGYFVLIWLLLLSLMPTPRTAAGVVAWCVGGVLAVFSTQAALLAAPFWVLRVVHGVNRRDARDVVFAAVQMTAVLVMIVVGHRAAEATKLAGGLPAFDVDADALRAAFGSLGWVVAVCVDAALLPRTTFERLEAHGTLAVVVPALLVAAGVALAVRTLSERGRVTVCLAIYLFVSSLYLVLVGRPLIAFLLQGGVPGATVATLIPLGTRHRALPNLALLLLAAGIIDGTEQRRVRVVTTVVACVGLLLAWVPGFRVPAAPDCQWPLWAARLDRKLAAGSREPLVIPSCPPFFDIAIDASPPPGQSLNRP